jgi:hypothetical protein
LEECQEEVADGWQEFIYLFKNGKWYFAEIYRHDADEEGKSYTMEFKELKKEFLEREFEAAFGKQKAANLFAQISSSATANF